MRHRCSAQCVPISVLERCSEGRPPRVLAQYSDREEEDKPDRVLVSSLTHDRLRAYSSIVLAEGSQIVYLQPSISSKWTGRVTTRSVVYVEKSRSVLPEHKPDKRVRSLGATAQTRRRSTRAIVAYVALIIPVTLGLVAQSYEVHESCAPQSENEQREDELHERAQRAKVQL